MSKYKNLPRCPWCGYMMRLKKFTPNGAGYEAYYRCTNCDVDSPHVYAESTEEAENKAYKAATNHFYNPGNRVLTLEEVLEIVRQNADGYNHICWLEKVDVRGISTPGFLGGYGIHSEIYVNFDFYEVVTEYPDCVPREGYGKTWRCWMRNPTAQEMAETPWEGEAGDRHDE